MNPLTATAKACLFVFLMLSADLAIAGAYDEIVTRLKQIHADYPNATELFSLGKNDQGADIIGLRLGTKENEGDKPRFLVVATHHGNEIGSTKVALQFIDDVLAKDRRGQLEERIYDVIPVLNISGYNARTREETQRDGEDVDANRDYPDPCRDDAPYRLASTRLLAEFVEQENITAAVTIHGYYGSFTFPWGLYTTDTHTLDHQEFLALTKSAVTANGYNIGTHAEVMYPAVGAFEDWAYYELGVWVTLMEVAYKTDAAKDSQALLKFFNRVPHQRSAQHQHTGSCRSVVGPLLSRP